jgi:hypothetical protein
LDQTESGSKSLTEKGVLSIAFGETSTAHEPSAGAFDDPTTGLGGEPGLVGGRANELHAEERAQRPVDPLLHTLEDPNCE